MTFEPGIDFIAAIVTILGLIIVGQKLWWGWLIKILSEVLWVIYAFQINSGGLLLLCIVYTVIMTRNMIVWRSRDASTR